MKDEHDIIVVTVTRHEDGLFTAQSADLAGVYMAHREIEKILEDIPNVIRLWFRRHRHMEVEVFQGPLQKTDDSIAIPALPIPAEIAARALAR
jgi:hypothetical protein